MLWEFGWNTYNTIERKRDCQEQLQECQQQVARLDSTLKAQTEYYLNFHGIHKAMLPGDTVILVVH